MPASTFRRPACAPWRPPNLKGAPMQNPLPTPIRRVRQSGAFRPQVESLEDRTLLAAGALDLTFGADGKFTTAIGSSSGAASGVALHADGKIVVAGCSSNSSNDDIAVVRYNADGSLDSSFDGDGKLTTPIGSADDRATSVAVQADGKIVVAGFSSNG